MAADLASIQIVVDAKAAVDNLKQLTSALKEAGTSGDQASTSLPPEEFSKFATLMIVNGDPAAAPLL